MSNEITKEYVSSKMPERPIDANKGTFGTLCSITGSYSMAGACVLSSLAALKSGVGLLKLVVPKSIYPIVAQNVIEAVYVPVEESVNQSISLDEADRIIEVANASNAVLFGCGVKNTNEVRGLLEKLLSKVKVPILIDADGLNALSKDVSILKDTKAEVVLTPHVLEMARLISKDKDYVIENRQRVAMGFSFDYPNTTLVLKGRETIVAKNGTLVVNPTGNQGMAKAGSGDVLSGIISSLIAQGVKPFDAAKMGVYIHGMSGDIAKEKLGDVSMIARDLVRYLPETYKSL